MKYLILAVALIGSASADCSIIWPNNTDTALHWWQCPSVGGMQVFNCTPFDTKGNYEYPIHLGQPLVMDVYVDNPTNTYTSPNLRDDILLWGWNTISCAWTSLPTFGLLNNQDACANGMPCPVKPGKQWLPVNIDFTPYQAIINHLQDNEPYQLQYTMRDLVTKDMMCIMFQARAYIH